MVKSVRWKCQVAAVDLYGLSNMEQDCLFLQKLWLQYISYSYFCTDDRRNGRSSLRNTFAFKEPCSLQNRDVVEVVRTVYGRPPPWSDLLPTIHVITPTYSRPVQKAELTRLANTLLHVPNLHWILVEDSLKQTTLVSHFLQETKLNYTHLNVETPRNYKVRGDTRDARIPRGTIQRNLALRWLRETCGVNCSQSGVVYFADDDNTYSLELFEEVNTKTLQCNLSLLKTFYFKCKSIIVTQMLVSIIRCAPPKRCQCGQWPLWVAYGTSPQRSTPEAKYMAGRQSLIHIGPLPLTWLGLQSTCSASSPNLRLISSCME